MSAIKFLLRKGEELDRLAIHSLLASYEMEADLPPSDFMVVEINGQLAGAARLEWEDQGVYVRPILVNPAWRRRSIGTALIRALTQNLSVLHVVARGQAIGFYRKLGFQPMSWDQVPERYRDECETCPNSNTCHPEPMVLTVSL